jgi:hypothetical protein
MDGGIVGTEFAGEVEWVGEKVGSVKVVRLLNNVSHKRVEHPTEPNTSPVI